MLHGVTEPEAVARKTGNRRVGPCRGHVVRVTAWRVHMGTLEGAWEPR